MESRSREAVPSLECLFVVTFQSVGRKGAESMSGDVRRGCAISSLIVMQLTRIGSVPSAHQGLLELWMNM